MQAGRPLGADPSLTFSAPALTEVERDEYLARADRLYRELVASDDQTLAMTLHAVNAMQGIAVVAESRGEIEEAQRWYESAAERAEPFYPQLAVWARQRSATADVYAQPITLPKNAQLPAAPGCPAGSGPVRSCRRTARSRTHIRFDRFGFVSRFFSFSSKCRT